MIDNDFPYPTLSVPMVPWEAFHSLVKPMAQECPTPIIDAAIKAACIEFCWKTLIWNMETLCGSLEENDRVYKYNNSKDDVSNVMPICCILREYNEDGTHIDHVAHQTNLQDLDTYDPQWRNKTAKIPTKFYMKDPNTVVFVEKPKDIGNVMIHMLCAVKPNRKARGVAEFIYEDWAEEIASGALARLHAMAGRVWANPQLVSFHQSKFRAGISRAKSKMYKSHVTQSKTMLPVEFGNIGI